MTPVSPRRPRETTPRTRWTPVDPERFGKRYEASLLRPGSKREAFLERWSAGLERELAQRDRAHRRGSQPWARWHKVVALLIARRPKARPREILRKREALATTGKHKVVEEYFLADDRATWCRGTPKAPASARDVVVKRPPCRPGTHFHMREADGRLRSVQRAAVLREIRTQLTPA